MATELKSIQVRDNYELVFRMMEQLHNSEQEMFNKAAPWSDIGMSYMRHVINCQEENDGIFLVAYVEEKPAGFMFAYTEEQDDSRIETYTGAEMYVSDGFIYPQYRRIGLYKLLNVEIERLYLERGVKRISRFTLATNTRMQEFLSSQGYKATRIIYEKWFSNDDKIDPLVLQKPE